MLIIRHLCRVCRVCRVESVLSFSEALNQDFVEICVFGFDKILIKRVFERCNVFNPAHPAQRKKIKP
jgi:hypothetical protein